MSSETRKRGRDIAVGERVRNAAEGTPLWFMVFRFGERKEIDGASHMGRVAYNQWGERMNIRDGNSYTVKEAKLHG